MKLDKTDLGILCALDTNARQSYNQIAKQVRVSKEVVQYRIKRLEKEKFIEGYSALVDFAAFGLLLIRVYIKLQNEEKGIKEKMLNELVELPESFVVFDTDFSWDIATALVTRSLKEFSEKWETFEVRYKKHIAKLNTSVFYDFVHYPRKYLSPDKNIARKEFSTGVTKPQTFDETNLKLLKLVASNAKILIITLSEQLGLTSSAVIYKLRKLEKDGVILAYRAIIDFTKYGYEYYKIDLDLEDLTVKQRISNFLRQHPNVVYEDRTVGGSNLEFDVEVPSYEAFFRIMQELKAVFPNAIRGYTFYKTRKSLKTMYVPF